MAAALTSPRVITPVQEHFDTGLFFGSQLTTTYVPDSSYLPLPLAKHAYHDRRRSSAASSLVDEGYSSGHSTLDQQEELSRMESLSLLSPPCSPSQQVMAAQTYLLPLEQLQHHDIPWTSPQYDTNLLPACPIIRSNTEAPRRAHNNLHPIVVTTGHRKSLPVVPTIASSQQMSFTGRRASVSAFSPYARPSDRVLQMQQSMQPASFLTTETDAFYQPHSAALGPPPLWSPAPHSATPTNMSSTNSYFSGAMSRRFSVPFLPDSASSSMFATPAAVFTHASMQNLNMTMLPCSLPSPAIPGTPSTPSPVTPSSAHSNKQYIFVNEDPGTEPIEIPAFIDPTSGEPTTIDEAGMVVSLSEMDLYDPSEVSMGSFPPNFQSYIDVESSFSSTAGDHAATPHPQSDSVAASNTRFKCVCGKLFEKLASLKSHARLHRAERNHVCSTCDRAFVRRQDLKRHTSTHNSNFKPYECSNCSTTFTRSDALHRHLKAKRCM
ncbi:hypothetical protein HKX48_003630 [Thoreauomyces humboldtii]|nr:hypothetical protein HKX48_003630 [Thoreauomyces humboldtii]